MSDVVFHEEDQFEIKRDDDSPEQQATPESASTLFNWLMRKGIIHNEKQGYIVLVIIITLLILFSIIVLTKAGPERANIPTDENPLIFPA